MLWSRDQQFGSTAGCPSLLRLYRTANLTQIHHLKKCKTSLEPAVKAGYDDL